MSKFRVGEIAQIVSVRTAPNRYIGEHVRIERLGPFKAGDFDAVYERHFRDDADYLVEDRDGIPLAVKEHQLRKLPPDSTEDPGLTRIKKLLLQDTKQKEREHERV